MDLSITQAGIAIGTPQYMSPEQAQALAIDARTDVWSLGTVLYEMLAGAPAISDRGSMFDIMVAVVREEIPSIRKVAPWVPLPLAEVVHAALVKDREKRMPDAASFAQRLVAAIPEIAMGSSGRLSLVDISMPTSTLEDVPAPAQIIGVRDDAPTEAPPPLFATDEEIPVSIAFESASTTPPPPTLRDAQAVPVGTEPPPAAPSAPPSEPEPPSSAHDRVEVFQRLPGGAKKS
jgi:serine/threonine-protein kinase